MPSKRGNVENSVKWPAVALVAAGAFAVLPIPPPLVERVYSRGWFALLQPPLTFASNAAPFAWLDALIVAVLVFLIARFARDVSRDGVARALARTLFRVLVWSAGLYLVFLCTWGFNYRRQRLVERLPYEASAVTTIAAQRLAGVSVDRVNALHAAAHQDGWITGNTIDPALAGAFDRVTRDLGSATAVVVGRPKTSWLDWYMQRTGVAGMTDPFFLETLVAGDLLPFERPMVIAHEWAHLAGLADEGEANVAAWLACLRGTIPHQYSAWLFMYGEAAGNLSAGDRAALAARLADGPRADLRAMRERSLAHINPRLSAAGWQVYDSYLKANRVEAGTLSYSEVVRLALGLEVARQAW